MIQAVEIRIAPRLNRCEMPGLTAPIDRSLLACGVSWTYR
jgi:hypothetical protein